MKLLIDANVLLDVLQDREPHALASSLVWKLCESGQAKGYVSALAFANLVYVMRREMDAEKIERTLQSLSLIFEFTELGASDLSRAAELRWDDFEDALQCVTAERLGTDFIITRNVRDFLKSPVPAVTPFELLERIDG